MDPATSRPLAHRFISIYRDDSPCPGVDWAHRRILIALIVDSSIDIASAYTGDHSIVGIRNWFNTTFGANTGLQDLAVTVL